MKARFDEDFGDQTVWEGHRKSLKLPRYPHRWAGDQALLEGLIAAFTADPDLDVVGLTVGEMLDLVGIERTAVDASLLSLRP